MARYFVQAQHTPEECLATLDSIVAQDANAISRFDFGCAVGDHSNHVCMATLEAPNAEAILAGMPASLRAKTQVTEVGQYTAAQVRAYHGS